MTIQMKTYLQILIKRWWILLIGFAVVLVATLVWTLDQGPIYESKTTYILSPRNGADRVEDEFVRALEMVSRRVEINTTFAEVAESTLIKSQALSKADYSTKQIENLFVSAVVLGGTNVLEITVEGSSPEVAQEFCDLVGQETQDYVSNLYDVFELQLLDSASYQKKPIRPNISLNLLIGGFLGLGLGALMALIFEYFVSPYSEPGTFNILDRETGAYNRAYLMHRLRQEINRAKRHEYPISLGFIRIDVEGEGITDLDKNEFMRLFKIMVEAEIRDEDIVASIDKDTFAFLYPYLSTQQARYKVDNLGKKFSSLAQDVSSTNGDLYLTSFTAAVGYTASDTSETSMVERGLRALRTKLPVP